MKWLEPALTKLCSPTATSTQAAATEKRHQKACAQIVELLSEGDLVAVEGVGDGVELSSAEPRAERAWTLLSVLLLQELFAAVDSYAPPVPSELTAVFRECIDVERREVHIDCRGGERDVKRCANAQVVKDMHQRQAVLAAADAYKDMVAILQHVVFGGRFCGLAA